MSGADNGCSADKAVPGTRLVGLLEVFDRSGATVTRLPVTTTMPTSVAGALIAMLGASEASWVACATIRS